MPEGYFTGRKAKPPTEIDIALSEQKLREVWGEIGPLCVKRKYGDFGVAVMTNEGDLPIRVYPRRSGSWNAVDDIDDAADGIERFATWRDVAAAGWQVD